MIFVARDPALFPDHLAPADPTGAAPLSKGAQELADAAAHLAAHGTPPPADEFKAYSHGSVKDALLTLFHGKCAYCESPAGASSQTDIEHFRPKGRVKEAGDAGIAHPGYWWLAMVWENLVLSCMHCNQGRHQVIIQEDWTPAQIEEAILRGKTVKRGKLDSFPTRDNIWATGPEAGQPVEQALLIDPTVTDPEQHLEWRIDGTLSVLVPRGGSDMGRATIDVLGLNRRWLTEVRMQKLLRLRSLAAKVRKYINRANMAADDQAAQDAIETAKDFLSEFAAECQPQQPYSAIGKQLFNRLLDELTETLT